MVFQVGDRVVAESESIEPARPGTVREVRDVPRGTVSWDDGHESIYTPAAGALSAEPARGAAANALAPAAGISARSRVPAPGGLSTSRWPSSASTRSASPGVRCRGCASAPPMPSSLTSTITLPFARSTRTLAFDACAYLATFVSASATT